MNVMEDLAFRGQCYQVTSAEGLRQHLSESRSVYCGFDPTADSLTIGNLVPIVLLARFQQAGHRPVVVMGGGTGLIGDPSGKEAERPVLGRETVERHVESQRRIFERLLDFSGRNAALITNNLKWLEGLSYLGVLRDLGKHFSVNMMIQRDSIRDRLQNREQGISYTEFSYMLLQAYDFLHLFDQHGVTVQAAGSDQWGNIVSGVELIRRLRKQEAFGLTAPLVTKADGGKFGKTEEGAVWLSADRTSPYAFYQFWLNTADQDLEKYLKTFTLFSHARISELVAEHAHDPGQRAAQRALAAHMTELLHGKDALEQARAATQALFSGQVANLPADVLDELFANAPAATLPRVGLDGAGFDMVELLVDAAVAKSKREARELLTSRAIQVNGVSVDAETRLHADSLLHGKVALVRRGKKHWHVVRFA